jgi:hypothetical protein
MPPLVVWVANPQANDRRILLRAPQSLTISRVDGAGESAQGHLGGSERSADLTRTQAATAFHQLLALEPLQPLPQRCWCGHHNRVQLIEGRGAVLDG